MRKRLLTVCQFSLTAMVLLILISACTVEPALEVHPPDPTPLLPTLGIPPEASVDVTQTVQPVMMLSERVDPDTASATSATVTPELHPAETIQAGNHLPPEDNIQVREKDGAAIVLIPEGEFMMGCDPDHNAGFECRFDELPLRAVNLPAYYIDQHEVTNGQYRHCVEAGFCPEPIYQYSLTRLSYYAEPAYSDYPVIAVTWYEASAFCHWVGGRLPTEAEWEKAAKGSLQRAFPWGDSLPNCGLANAYNNATGDFCVGDTVKVGSYPAGASPYGVMDMAGNVWEWVLDTYRPGYDYQIPPDNPPGTAPVSDKVIRGGGFDYSWSKLRVVYKSNHHPNTRHVSYGFRCANQIEDALD